VRRIRPDLGLAHFVGVPLAVKYDESTDPAHVRLLGSEAIMAGAKSGPDAIE
jgi:hypothetical protein